MPQMDIQSDLYFTRRENGNQHSERAAIDIVDYNEIKQLIKRHESGYQVFLDAKRQQLTLFQNRMRPIKYHAGLGHITAPAGLTSSEAYIVMLVAHQAAKWRGVKLFGEPTDNERLNLFRGAAHLLQTLKNREARELRPREEHEIAAITTLYCDKEGMPEMVLPSDAAMSKEVYQAYRDVVVSDRLLHSHAEPRLRFAGFLSRLLSFRPKIS